MLHTETDTHLYGCCKRLIVFRMSAIKYYCMRLYGIICIKEGNIEKENRWTLSSFSFRPTHKNTIQHRIKKERGAAAGLPNLFTGSRSFSSFFYSLDLRRSLNRWRKEESFLFSYSATSSACLLVAVEQELPHISFFPF